MNDHVNGVDGVALRPSMIFFKSRSHYGVAVVGIKDVAREAGVSVGTVSNVINRPDSVGADRRHLVEEAIARLGYVRNESARQLRAGSSRLIALVVLDVTNPFFADVIAGAEEAAEDVGALVLVANSAGSREREASHLARLGGLGLMGVLLSPVHDGQTSAMGELRRREIPLILVDRVAGAGAGPSVAVDDVCGGSLAGEHLRARGHRSVAYVGGPQQLAQVRDRLAGLRAAVGENVEIHVFTCEEMSISAGSRAAAQIFANWPDQRERPTAVFCANDLLALGVLNECLRRGVRVPHDLALVGYDDIGYAGAAAVPLTSIRQPRQQLGRTAVELLVKSIATGPTFAQDGPEMSRSGNHVEFIPELVPRESTRYQRSS